MARAVLVGMFVTACLVFGYAVVVDYSSYEDAQRCLAASGMPVLSWARHSIHGGRVICLKAAAVQYVPM